jgi:hypothetical protein
MTVFLVETYVVKPEKQAELVPLYQKFIKIMEVKKGKFKEVKSFKLYSQWFGTVGGYIGIWEFTNMADCEKWSNNAEADEELMKPYQEFLNSVLVPGTYSTHVWRNVMEHTVNG